MITLTKKNGFSLLFLILSIILFLVGSIEIKAGYFVFAIFFMLFSILLFLGNEECLKKVLQKIKPSSNSSEPTYPPTQSKEDSKGVIADPHVIKLNEVITKN
jgi:ABC-type antimicrobial peptide transport system permease subunit